MSKHKNSFTLYEWNCMAPGVGFEPTSRSTEHSVDVSSFEFLFWSDMLFTV